MNIFICSVPSRNTSPKNETFAHKLVRQKRVPEDIEQVLMQKPALFTQNQMRYLILTFHVIVTSLCMTNHYCPLHVTWLNAKRHNRQEKLNFIVFYFTCYKTDCSVRSSTVLFYCSTLDIKSYGFETTWGGVNDNRMLCFGWTISLICKKPLWHFS